VELDEQKHKYLARLAAEQAKREFTVEQGGGSKQRFLKVANADTPQLNERILCGQDDDGSH
jgi:hypothetical protein